jgi:uncharacterized membrane protein
MQLDNFTSVLIVCFGALTVAFFSWSRFDEPSCDSQSEHFARYKPRFSTSRGNYLRAKVGYICALVLIYFVLSLVPELYASFANIDKSSHVGPLVVALALITLQNVPLLKDAECRIRGFLHSFARIPECVRRTVARMRSSPFNFPPNVVAAQTRKLNLPAHSNTQLRAILNTLLDEDDLLHGWYSVGCVLSAMSDRNRDTTGIDSLFFDFYKDELDGIAARHAALAELVREHVADRIKAKTSGGSASKADTGEPAAAREIRDLRERLYTFVACGVHSSVKHDGESLEIIEKLGFAVTPDNREYKSVVGPLVGLSFIALVVLSTVSSVWTEEFDEFLQLRVTEGWRNAFPMIPTRMPEYFIWSCFSAAFYFSAVFGALIVRNARIIRRDWFDINNLQRERPVLRYIMPTLVGMALGCFTLSMIAIAGGPGFKSSISDAGKAVLVSFPWFPLATVMAFIAVFLSDSPPQKNNFWQTALIRAAYGAIAMALVGFFMSDVVVSTTLKSFAEGRQLPASVTQVSVYVQLFIASQIAVLTFVLCIVMQVAERYTARARCLAGQQIDIITRQGPEFRIAFDRAGEASMLPAKESNGASAPLCRGQWQLFPEGTAVKWNVDAGESGIRAGSFGLISSCGDSMIYEGYAEQFAGRPDFLGQVRLRANGNVTAAPTEPPAPAPAGDKTAAAPAGRPAPAMAAVAALAPRHWRKALKPNAHRKPALEKV